MIRLVHSPSVMGQAIPLAPGMEGILQHWQARAGEILTMADPGGHLYRSRLLTGLKEAVVFEKLSSGIEPPGPRWLCPVLPDRERMILIVQKGVELGATVIQPLISERSSAGDGGGMSSSQDKSATWNRVALRAARQCRRAIIPELHPVRTLEEFLRADPPRHRAFLDPGTDRTPLVAWHRAGMRDPLALLSGPEGGWSDRERGVLLQAGTTAISLGFRILRAETAAIAAMAVVAALDGAFT
ncbi:MAG: RsmE family RNA methyltransferase [Magnetococcales bacterium]|nr:RsmE family RNA methyltransferase [Magnetococcales bacterium]